MSKYGSVETVVRDEEYLVEALKEVGYEVEIHPQGAPLGRYYSEQEGKTAHVIIRRSQLHGAFGDIGFARPRLTGVLWPLWTNLTSSAATTRSGWGACSNFTKRSKRSRQRAPRATS
jgi:hypothetical protein